MSFRKIGIGVVCLLGFVFVMSSDAKDQVSNDGLTVSHDASKDPPFEWTLERMLLAVPMPMTAEGRKFLSTHPNLDNVRAWSDAQFDNYLDSDYATQNVAEEACRWRDLAQLLARQVSRGYSCLGKPAPEPAKAKTTIDWGKLSIDDIGKMVAGKDRKVAFEQLKAWRQEIADWAPKVEAIRKEAEAKGLSEKLEQAMTPDQ